jgi:hypothetical protein
MLGFILQNSVFLPFLFTARLRSLEIHLHLHPPKFGLEMFLPDVDVI